MIVVVRAIVSLAALRHIAKLTGERLSPLALGKVATLG